MEIEDNYSTLREQSQAANVLDALRQERDFISSEIFAKTRKLCATRASNRCVCVHTTRIDYIGYEETHTHTNVCYLIAREKGLPIHLGTQVSHMQD